MTSQCSAVQCSDSLGRPAQSLLRLAPDLVELLAWDGYVRFDTPLLSRVEPAASSSMCMTLDCIALVFEPAALAQRLRYTYSKETEGSRHTAVVVSTAHELEGMTLIMGLTIAISIFCTFPLGWR